VGGGTEVCSERTARVARLVEIGAGLAALLVGAALVLAQL